MLTLNDGRAELWQWDTGRTLTVDADCSQVHFSNKVFGRSIDVDVIDGVAIIPDILLQTDKDLNVWAFVGTAENGYTKISKTFKVNRRNKPADYVFTPPDQTSIEEIKEKIDYLESIQDPDAIKNAVGDYLEKNPVESPVQSVNGKTGTVELTAEDVGAISNETDPTVPAWAKEPKKPAYTASEVGAMSAETLPAAINTALAQAKASGEFDGQDGATPNIQIGTVETLAAGSPATASMGGTPENPLLNLGIPQGASGSGGSGIAVSGATVGQTVKISAVDDNGVPTAWEPVDFPSGGGVWELLEDVDITEETAIIQVTNLKPTYTEILCIVDDLIATINNYQATVWANSVQINSGAIKTFKDSDNPIYRSNNWCRCVLYGGYCVCYCATDTGTDMSVQICRVSRGATYIGNFETFEIRSAHSSSNFASGKIKIYAR